MNANAPRWWAWERANPAAQDPQCLAAAAGLRRIADDALAIEGVVVTESAPWGLRVQIGGAEVDLAIRPTGVLEKTCADVTCGKKFWRGESGSPTARFHTEGCRRRQKMRDYRARTRGAAEPVPRIISRVLASDGHPRAADDSGNSGFCVTGAEPGVVTVTAGPPAMLSACATTLEKLGYAVEDRGYDLLVTAGKGNAQ